MGRIWSARLSSEKGGAGVGMLEAMKLNDYTSLEFTFRMLRMWSAG